eukprot:2148396-Pyramimonas_sp.AAC.1
MNRLQRRRARQCPKKAYSAVFASPRPGGRSAMSLRSFPSDDSASATVPESTGESPLEVESHGAV